MLRAAVSIERFFGVTGQHMSVATIEGLLRAAVGQHKIIVDVAAPRGNFAERTDFRQPIVDKRVAFV